MLHKFSLVILLFSSFIVKAQFTDDADRLKNMPYMQHYINCDSTSSGSNLAHRYCLNKEFQETDSILNVTLNKVLANYENSSSKNDIIQIQKTWVSNRHNQARLVAYGYKGHMAGIKYLHYMVVSTKSRTKELECFLVP